ncbi:hypothetical protein ABH935_004180 [Catenulispora sp. GAS73]|uniref:hypothetical protein n=1 Tax=Catenulispora sp. GAS73 TaxID=3156269 RepID=UPI0035137525
MCVRSYRIDAVRCVPSPQALAALSVYVIRDIPRLARAFERVVDPLLDHRLSDPGFRKHVRSRLLATGLKVGLAMWGYAGAADVCFDLELTMLGGAFTRLYDDLMDDTHRPGFDRRFATGVPDEDSELEALLIALLLTIARHLNRTNDDPVFAMVWRVHEWQVRSLRQRQGDIEDAEVAAITLGKGGWGVATLCALLRPGMLEEEQAVIVRLGGLLQLLDDHYDLSFDLAHATSTTATRRLYSFGDLVNEAAAVRRELRSHYAPGRDRRLAAVMAAMLVIVPSLRIRERLAKHPPASRRASGLQYSPRMLFLRRAHPIDVQGR